MKKYLVMLFGAMLTMAASAQPQGWVQGLMAILGDGLTYDTFVLGKLSMVVNGYQLDSIKNIDSQGELTDKIFFECNENGLLTNWVVDDTPFFSFTYDADGYVNCMANVITVEHSDFDSNGRPTVFSLSGGFQKYVINKYADKNVEEYDYYVRFSEDSNWIHLWKGRLVYNKWGGLETIMRTVSDGGTVQTISITQ